MYLDKHDFDLAGEWVKQWEGHWSLLSCTYFGHQYTKTIETKLGTCIPRSVFVSRKGHSTCFFPKEELRVFGEALAKRVMDDEHVAKKWCIEVKKQADFMKKRTEAKSEISSRDFHEFVSTLYDYVIPHAAVKRVVDYLPPRELETLLPLLQEARVYAENAYAESEDFTHRFAMQIAGKTGLRQGLVLCLTKEELETFLAENTLPEKATLESRFHSAALRFKDGKYDVITGKKVDETESTLLRHQKTDELKGTTAFPGKASGVVRIVVDPSKPGEFNQGDVLVTGMTRPTYMHLINKASAIVTDAGGILCHAAIIARELKKPCIVGTHRATKVFRTGDMVEVNADQGIVKKARG